MYLCICQAFPIREYDDEGDSSDDEDLTNTRLHLTGVSTFAFAGTVEIHHLIRFQTIILCRVGLQTHSQQDWSE